MKKVIALTIISYLFVFTLYAQKQECCLVSKVKKTSNYWPPKFLDSSKFIIDLKDKVDLKWTFDQFEKQGAIGTYLYTFGVNKQGKVEPRLYYNKNLPELRKVHQFVTNVFNKYKWQPGYKKGCKACIATRYLQLGISTENEEKQVEVSITDIVEAKEIFQWKIAYSDLKSFK